MSLNIEDGDDARLQLRYEVEKVLEASGGQCAMRPFYTKRPAQAQSATKH